MTGVGWGGRCVGMGWVEGEPGGGGVSCTTRILNIGAKGYGKPIPVAHTTRPRRLLIWWNLTVYSCSRHIFKWVYNSRTDIWICTEKVMTTSSSTSTSTLEKTERVQVKKNIEIILEIGVAWRLHRKSPKKYKYSVGRHGSSFVSSPARFSSEPVFLDFMLLKLHTLQFSRTKECCECPSLFRGGWRKSTGT
jgi:hypothetical protein